MRLHHHLNLFKAVVAVPMTGVLFFCCFLVIVIDCATCSLATQTDASIVRDTTDFFLSTHDNYLIRTAGNLLHADAVGGEAENLPISLTHRIFSSFITRAPAPQSSDTVTESVDPTIPLPAMVVPYTIDHYSRYSDEFYALERAHNDISTFETRVSEPWTIGASEEVPTTESFYGWTDQGLETPDDAALLALPPQFLVLMEAPDDHTQAHTVFASEMDALQSQSTENENAKIGPDTAQTFERISENFSNIIFTPNITGVAQSNDLGAQPSMSTLAGYHSKLIEDSLPDPIKPPDIPVEGVYSSLLDALQAQSSRPFPPLASAYVLAGEAFLCVLGCTVFVYRMISKKFYTRTPYDYRGAWRAAYSKLSMKRGPNVVPSTFGRPEKDGYCSF